LSRDTLAPSPIDARKKRGFLFFSRRNPETKRGEFIAVNYYLPLCAEVVWPSSIRAYSGQARVSQAGKSWASCEPY